MYRNNNNNSRNRRNRNGPRKFGGRNNSNRSNNHRTILDYSDNRDNLTIFNERGRFMPDREFIKMRFVDQQRTRGNTAAQVTNWFYNSDVSNVDGGGNTPVGYDELFLMYRRFRVHSMTIHFQLSNPLTTPITIVLWPANQNNTYIANLATLLNIQEAQCLPGSTSCITGTVNASSVSTCSVLASAKKLMTNSYFRDDDTATDGVNSPTRLFFINVGIYNSAGANFGSLLPIKVMIDMEVECYERHFVI